jgi:hypothetical protein
LTRQAKPAAKSGGGKIQKKEEKGKKEKEKEGK